MQSEIEIKFPNINYEKITKKMIQIGAIKTKERTLMKRVVYHIEGDRYTYLRIRDEGDKIMVTLKRVENENAIDGVKEINVQIDNFDGMKDIFDIYGLKYTSYQETYREEWDYYGVQLCIDEWPGIKPFLEIEGQTESDVKNTVKKLGLKYENGVFGSADTIYEMETGISKDIINRINLITFENPPQIQN